MKQFGLTDKQAEESRQKYGDNSMTEQASESFWDKLKGNLGDPMIKILIVALLINVVLAVLGGVGIIKEGAPEWYEPLGIFVAIALAPLVSTVAEYRNENAFQKLQEEASRIMCKVYRNGEIAEVAINDIVVGDAILLQSGDKVPADGIIIDGDIKADQSVLNGESREAKKLAVPEGWKDTDESLNFANEHKVFRGSVVCSGNAVMEVTVVGDKSVYGGKGVLNAVKAVNEVIGRHLDVTTEFITQEEARGRFDLKRLPDDASQTVRIVKVGDYDECLCIGTHVANTAEIGTFRIISHDWDEAEQRWRIRFRLA